MSGQFLFTPQAAKRWAAGAAVTLAAAGSPAFAQDAGATTWQLQLPGISHHFGKPELAGRSYNELHDGLGLQKTEVRPSYVRRMTAGFMRDSFNKQGLYAGASGSWRAFDGAFTVDAGAAAMLLYRTTGFTRDDRKLIPIVLPMLAVEHKASGIGGNLTVLPAGNFGKDLRFPGLIYLQFTYRLRS
jgi:hypothetical protein